MCGYAEETRLMQTVKKYDGAHLPL
jgi:hypothetical protein